MSEKRYWRSIEQRAGDPAVQQFVDREFPEGASVAPEGISRRNMLTLIGASVSMAGLTACRPEERIVPFVNAPPEVVPGIPRKFATTMPFGLSAYGVVVTSHEGRPTKIEGNELHPASGGGSSSHMQASILDLYDPDRASSVQHVEETKSWADFAAAWSGLAAAHAADGGSGLAVLGEPFASPALFALRDRFLERFPQAAWVSWEPIHDGNQLAGLEQATGQALRASYDFSAADVILSLDCDFLLTESDAVRNSRGFGEGRRVLGEHDSMNRLWCVEGVHSLTGANADHRLRVSSSQIGTFVAMLADELKAADPSVDLPEIPAPTLPGVDGKWLEVLARDLLEHRGRSLIVAGRRQPADVHAAVLKLNEVLGNLGTTISLHELEDAAPADTTGFKQLAAAISAGEISTLVLMGGNPAYNAPADLGFAEALGSVQTVIRLGHSVDETSAVAHWKLPRSHFLESWGDARACDGTQSICQPLIEPLLGGKSDLELASMLVHDEQRPAYDLIRESWATRLPAADFESAWNRVLHDGLLAGSALPHVEAAISVDGLERLASAAPANATDLELVFRPSPATWDGRFANNGWLQELADPITKITWDNAALISPATATNLGITSGDVVRVTLGERQIEIPASVAPGQADSTVSIDLGYGREAAGRVGNGVGSSGYRLQTVDHADIATGVRLEKLGTRHLLAMTQDHQTLDELGKTERERRSGTIIREQTLEGYREDPEFARHMVKMPHTKSMWQEHSYDKGPQWGMTIDLNVCTGCSACVIACQSENNIPIVGKDQVSRGREMHWLRIDRYHQGPVEDPKTVFQGIPCMHCENAPCEQVCPVAATTHSSEGLNTMAYNRCIGTRYCANNCPYKVRRFNFYNFTKDTTQIQQLAANPDVTIRSRGVMEKCSFCVQRINAAKIDAKRNGHDVEVTTACQQACAVKAIDFGDLTNENSDVTKMKKNDRNYALLEELYTKPRTTYLAKLRNPHPALVNG